MKVSSMANLSLRLLVDRKANKVIFAEAAKEFVDFLFATLSLPVGAISKILKDTSILGCTENLYNSLKNFDASYLLKDNTDSLLKHRIPPTHSNIALLLPDARQYLSMNFFTCSSCEFETSNSNLENCPGCGDFMLQEVENGQWIGDSGESGFVKESATYIVTDDLSVTPLTSLIDRLDKINLQNRDCLESMIVDVGMKEGLELLKASLTSDNALTSVFLSSNDKSNSSQKQLAKPMPLRKTFTIKKKLVIKKMRQPMPHWIRIWTAFINRYHAKGRHSYHGTKLARRI